jgi:acyl-CoA synthetase (AMP-forming)/AMP-acid ligase II
MTLGNVLNASAARTPQRTALALEDESISYEQLDHCTTWLAHWLLHHGRKPEDRIAIHRPNSIETVKLFFACFKAGMIAVPVNVRLKAPEVAYVLQHSKAAAYFAHPDLSAVSKEASIGCKGLHPIYAIPGVPGEKGRAVALPEAKDHDPAILLYTSGTTARPKGVTQTHQTLLEGVKLMCSAAPDSLRTSLLITPLAFISAICAGLLPAVVTGGTCVLAPVLNAPLILDLIERFQCTCTFGVPTMIQLLLDEQERKPRDVRSLRTFLAAGDSVPVSLQQRFERLFCQMARSEKSHFGVRQTLPGTGTIPRRQERHCETGGSLAAIWPARC